MLDQERIPPGAPVGRQLAELHHLLVETVKDYAIFAIGPTGIVLSWNAGAERLKGYKAEEIIGQSFTKFYEPELIARGFPQYELSVAAREGRFEDEGWRLRKDGSRFWANVIITALRDGEGRLIGFAKVTRDLTERRRAEEERAHRIAEQAAAKAEAERLTEESELLSRQAMELEMQATALQERNEELEALSEEQARTNLRLEEAVARAEAARAQADHAARMRDEVLSIVAHDLRNPLNTILMSASTMLELPLREEQRARQMAIVHRAATGMDRLIRDLLDVSRIESGSFAIRPLRVHVEALLDETMELFEAQAQPRGVALSCDVEHELPPARGDRDRLAQVLWNLIGNALRFTPAGGRIAVRATRVEDALQVSVEDSGSGIAPENLPHIFDRFWQADHASRASAGLGLTICKGIVEAHGGRIWVESEQGRGTTFHFTVPVAVA